LLFSSVMTIDAQNKAEVNSIKVNTMIKTDKSFVLLDVRTSEEFKEGHIKTAINIDIRQPDALTKIDKLDKKAKYIVHCRTNRRSKIAVDYMIQNGFKAVYQMTDGYIGWIQNSLAIEK